MILAAYLSLVIAVFVYLATTESIRRRDEALARTLGAIAGAGFASLGLLMLGKEGATTLGNVALLSLALGGVLYAWGLIRWRTRRGLMSRRVGWLLIVAALAVPSTLTLLLPVASLLVLTLRPMGEPRTVAVTGAPLGE